MSYVGEYAFVQEVYQPLGKIIEELGFGNKRSDGTCTSVKGLHVAFVHTYQGTDRHLFAKDCIILGYEQNKREMMFPGGKNDKKYNNTSPEDVFMTTASTLYRELCEEFGFAPTVDFISSIIKPIRINGSLILVVNINGISCNALTKAAAAKQRMHLESSFKEMAGYFHIPLDEVAQDKRISSYVRETIQQITSVYRSTMHSDINVKQSFQPDLHLGNTTNGAYKLYNGRGHTHVPAQMVVKPLVTSKKSGPHGSITVGNSGSFSGGGVLVSLPGGNCGVVFPGGVSVGLPGGVGGFPGGIGLPGGVGGGFPGGGLSGGVGGFPGGKLPGGGGLSGGGSFFGGSLFH